MFDVKSPGDRPRRVAIYIENLQVSAKDGGTLPFRARKLAILLAKWQKSGREGGTQVSALQRPASGLSKPLSPARDGRESSSVDVTLARFAESSTPRAAKHAHTHTPARAGAGAGGKRLRARVIFFLARRCHTNDTLLSRPRPNTQHQGRNTHHNNNTIMPAGRVVARSAAAGLAPGGLAARL